MIKISMEPKTGFEPVTSSLPRMRSTPELLGPFQKDNGAGDETRTRDIQLGRLTLYQLSYSRSWCKGQDSNLRRMLLRRVYSPVPLTARPPLLNCCCSNRLFEPISKFPMITKALNARKSAHELFLPDEALNQFIRGYRKLSEAFSGGVIHRIRNRRRDPDEP